MLHLGLDFKEYLKNSWNYIDILLICLSPCWSALRIYRIDSLYTDLALASLLMMRGIAPFKIFNGTRHYIRLILQSLNNIKYFLIIFLYLTMFFSVLIFIILRNDEQHDDTSFFDMVKMSWYLSATGNTDIQSKYVIISLVIFMSTILNLILMLNMLISNLGDSYDQFCFDKNIIDYRERISLTLEVQTALFWKNQVDKNHFVHILTRKFESKIEDDDDWQGRIMFTELKQEKRIESLEKIMNGLENKISLVDKKIETRFSAVDEKIDIICSQLLKSEIIQKK
jgi:preprotein translocase subunit SecG